jgi:hypothetical protein
MTKYITTFFTLVLTYILLGRKGAVPFGIAFFHSWLVVLVYMLIIELIQIPLFYFLFGPVASRLGWVIKLKARFRDERIKIEGTKIFKYAHKIGALGVFLVAVMPAGTGGVLGGIVLSKLLKLDFYKSLTAIISAILVCNLVLILGVEWFKRFIILLAH